MNNAPTLRESLEAVAARDPLVADVLAESRAAGADWPATLERMVCALQADRVKLAEELAPFRQHRVRMVPVMSMEEFGRHGADAAVHPPESGEWIPVQLPPMPPMP